MPFSKTRIEKLNAFQKKIGYRFNDVNLMMEALTHSSYANESKNKKHPYNERLEFLGDSVLSIIISDYIFHKYTHLPEGELTKVRANVVCEASLATGANKVGLGEFIMLGKGEDISGGRRRASILADAFEATIGAIYIDGGLEMARRFVLDNLEDLIELAGNGELFKDYKTHLQELLQSKTTDKIFYKVINEIGPDHDKTFEVEVWAGNQMLGTGEGKSKKEAEQNAAQVAFKKVKK
ncbi:ribonuclease III [Alkaliphilus hydrothermalis]|uniref:Ribonuclease 3 n=1 Tax=Alkaliphilus hydrothermalis TaxID=1482730 RepID=A0ABS2NL11_9FIRM|nr:ribonuclease III [Alkaliphilus hydrothermalis]MBM7613627.1 ribonuclease-3 [Alkaliphilus hydrothermalis]